MPELFNPASIFLNLDSGSESGMTTEEYSVFCQTLRIFL
jgi:hypothetical protein